jgi:hypothetical protein
MWLAILTLSSVVVFGLFLIPLTCFGAALGDTNSIGKGFATLDFDEVKEFNAKF